MSEAKIQNFAMIPNKALDAGLPAQAIVVLTVLARFRNHETGWTVMTHDALAERMGHRTDAKDRSYVAEMIRELRDAGVLDYQCGRGCRASRFRIIYDLQQQEAAVAEAPEPVLAEAKPHQTEIHSQSHGLVPWDTTKPVRPTHSQSVTLTDSYSKKEDQERKKGLSPRAEDLLSSCSLGDAIGGNAPDLVQKAYDLWNRRAVGKLHKALKLDTPRRDKLKRRLKDYFDNDLEQWDEYLITITSRPFLCGQNDRGWRADFAFALRPESILKILEGGYVDRDPTRDANGFTRVRTPL